jgi:hypothetical protein
MIMNATYTISHGYEYTGAGAVETINARARQLTGAIKPVYMLAAAPLLGLMFVLALPFAGLALIAWMLAKAAARNRVAIFSVVKRVALFFAAPFVALFYVAGFPFIAMGMLVYCGVRAART